MVFLTASLILEWWFACNCSGLCNVGLFLTEGLATINQKFILIMHVDVSSGDIKSFILYTILQVSETLSSTDTEFSLPDLELANADG
jgi:hypothetical protein